MGTSNWQNISYNIDIVKKLNPESILDIGVGFGRWGFLFREFLEIWGDRNYSGVWKRKIDGVEIFPGYIKEYHKFFYDNIFVCDAFEFMKTTGQKYDLINCGDVIEHFEKKKAEELIGLCLKKSRYVLINIPAGSNWQQSTINNNIYENHLSCWSVSDFTKYRNRLIRKFSDIEMRGFLVVLLSEDKIELHSAYGRYFGIKSILKNKLGFEWLIGKITGRNDN